MAFQSVTGASVKFVKLNEFEPGQTVEGFLTGVETSPNAFGSINYNFLLKTEEGETLKVFTNGNAKYVAKDVAQYLGVVAKDETTKEESIERAGKMVGRMIQIKSLGKFKNAKAQMVSKYEFLVDQDKLLISQDAPST